MSERIIDVLEMIEVQIHQGYFRSMTLGERDGLRQAVGQQRPVRQTCQKIVLCHIGHLRCGHYGGLCHCLCMDRSDNEPFVRFAHLGIAALSEGSFDSGRFFTPISGILAEIGSHLAQVGGILAQIRSILAQIGGILAQVGRILTQIRDLFTLIGGILAQISDLFALVGGYFSLAGRILPHGGGLLTLVGGLLALVSILSPADMAMFIVALREHFLCRHIRCQGAFVCPGPLPWSTFFIFPIFAHHGLPQSAILDFFARIGCPPRIPS